MEILFYILILLLLPALIVLLIYMVVPKKVKAIVLPPNATDFAKLLHGLPNSEYARCNEYKNLALVSLIKGDNVTAHGQVIALIDSLGIEEIVGKISRETMKSLRKSFSIFCKENGLEYPLTFFLKELPDTDARKINKNKKELSKNIGSNDFAAANLSFAKLAEGLRLLNEDTGGGYADSLSELTEIYEKFREQNGFEYPAEYKPRKPRKANFD